MYAGVPSTAPVFVIVPSALCDLRDPEVEDLHEIVLAAEGREKEVLGLHVAVHDPAIVRLAERARGLADDVKRPRRRERPNSQDVLGEGLALQQLHYVVPEPVLGRAVVEDANRVGCASSAVAWTSRSKRASALLDLSCCSGRRIFTATSRFRPG